MEITPPPNIKSKKTVSVIVKQNTGMNPNSNKHLNKQQTIKKEVDLCISVFRHMYFLRGLRSLLGWSTDDQRNIAKNICF